MKLSCKNLHLKRFQHLKRLFLVKVAFKIGVARLDLILFEFDPLKFDFVIDPITFSL